MGLVLMAVAAWALFLATTAASIALARPFLQRRLEGRHPALRAGLLRALTVAPVAVATLGVLLCFAPKIFGSFLSRADHCFEHADDHPHFCLDHPPHLTLGVEAWMALALIALVAVALVVVQGRRLRRSSRLLGQLTSTAQFDACAGAWSIETPRPVAMSVGVWRPRTVVSSGLLERIPPRLVEAIVAHERAHERRRDGLWKPVTEFLSFAHLPGTRRALLADLELACEQACDEEAGAELDDRVRVAEALLAMARLRLDGAGVGALGLAFGASGVPARVASLVVDPPEPGWSRRGVIGVFLLVCVAAAAAADPLHHLTETLIHHVLG